MTRNRLVTGIEMALPAQDIIINGSPKCFAAAQSTIGFALLRSGISYKKTLQYPKANQQARLNFQQQINTYQQTGNPRFIWMKGT